MDKCRKCRAVLPEGAKFCPACGAKQDVTQKPKARGNGQGSVYQLPNKTWIAVKTIGYTTDEAGKLHRKTCSRSGFRTKKGGAGSPADADARPEEAGGDVCGTV